MLELKLREEFHGRRLKGTTVDFTNQAQTGALKVPAVEFLKITYPSFDLLKTIKATRPGHSRPVVLLGARDQGKSHLLAALYHLCTDTATGNAWLTEMSLINRLRAMLPSNLPSQMWQKCFRPEETIL
jgi:hypothetical protein